VAIACILAVSVAAQDDAKQDAKQKDEEAKAKIAEFKKELKGAKTDKDVVRAIETLGALQHPKVLDELKSYLGTTADISAAAAEQISKYKKDKVAAETLMAGSNSRDTATAVKCIRYAGDTEYKGIVPKLANLFRHKEVDVAKEAVDSCAKIRSKDAIDPLLNLWRELDGIREEKNNNNGGLGGFGGGGITGTGGVGQSYQDEQLKRKRDLTPAVESAIKKITNEDFKDIRAANDWWRKNKGTFKDPE
jgi:hypothetical protein